jgi:hypothetical protein
MRPTTPLTLFTVYLALFMFSLLPVQDTGAHERHALAMQELDWQVENIKRVYTLAEDFHAGALILTWEVPGRVKKVEGRRCLVGPYFIFDVDDGFAFNIDETVTVDLLFDTGQTDGFIISYDHASDSPQARFEFWPAGHYLRDNHALVSGQEAPRTGHRDHTISLNISRYHDPVAFFLYHYTATAAQSDGGLFGYAHAMIDAFHVSRGLALDVPMGLVDFIMKCCSAWSRFEPPVKLQLPDHLFSTDDIGIASFCIYITHGRHPVSD